MGYISSNLLLKNGDNCRCCLCVPTINLMLNTPIIDFTTPCKNFDFEEDKGTGR